MNTNDLLEDAHAEVEAFGFAFEFLTELAEKRFEGRQPNPAELFSVTMQMSQLSAMQVQAQALLVIADKMKEN